MRENKAIKGGEFVIRETPYTAVFIPEEFDGTFDYALPQPWVDMVQKLSGLEENICGNFVWIYDSRAKIFGRPFPLTAEGSVLIGIFNSQTRGNFPTDQDVF